MNGYTGNGNSGPSYARHPGYRVDIELLPTRIRVVFDGATVAASARALLVRETDHPAVHYFPREDVCMDLLERTAHRTYCPFKGHASYWTVKVGGQVVENAAWSYGEPFNEVLAIKDYIAFNQDVIDL